MYDNRYINSISCLVLDILDSSSIIDSSRNCDDSKALIRVEVTCTALSTSASVQLSQPWKNGKDTATALRPEMAPSRAAPTVPDDSTEPLQRTLLNTWACNWAAQIFVVYTGVYLSGAKSKTGGSKRA